ncbi:hypothetical protein AOHp86_04400 [Helicobacter pylori]|nr:hypothetical protein JP0059_03800 [Helicobacter pylori]GHR33286.1 hypothetical protein JP0096_02040 [Helicobacter pylori]GHS58797.1 hypothetical protein JP0131_02040 [Helicobacter pylori]
MSKTFKTKGMLKNAPKKATAAIYLAKRFLKSKAKRSKTAQKRIKTLAIKTLIKVAWLKKPLKDSKKAWIKARDAMRF